MHGFIFSGCEHLSIEFQDDLHLYMTDGAEVCTDDDLAIEEIINGETLIIAKSFEDYTTPEVKAQQKLYKSECTSKSPRKKLAVSPIKVEKSPLRTSPRKIQISSPNTPTSSGCSSSEGSPGTSLTIELPDFMPFVKSCL